MYNLPDASRVQVLRDERTYAAWRATAASTIEIDTDVGEHRFEIATGYHGRAGGSDGERTTPGRPPPTPTATPIARTPSAIEIATAVSSISAACPCCAGTA